VLLVTTGIAATPAGFSFWLRSDSNADEGRVVVRVMRSFPSDMDPLL
jgi:hypothetical protein